MRKRENSHLSTSDEWSSDIHRGASASHSLNKDSLSQQVHVCLSPGRAPNKPQMNFLQPCHQRVAVWEKCAHQFILTNVIRQSTVTTDKSDLTIGSARCDPEARM